MYQLMPLLTSASSSLGVFAQLLDILATAVGRININTQVRPHRPHRLDPQSSPKPSLTHYITPSNAVRAVAGHRALLRAALVGPRHHVRQRGPPGLLRRGNTSPTPLPVYPSHPHISLTCPPSLSFFTARHCNRWWWRRSPTPTTTASSRSWTPTRRSSRRPRAFEKRDRQACGQPPAVVTP